MSIVLTFEPEDDFPEIFGIVSDLPPWKMCFLISRFTGLELGHEDAMDNAGPPFQLVNNAELFAFEKYIWTDDEENRYLNLINNRMLVENQISKSGQQNLLFPDEENSPTSIYLLEEWNYVNYLIKTEGLEDIFNPFDLKNIPGIRMVISATADKFKNYEKII